MTDELSIDGKQYISSKRASDLSGYAQDYVGQLARKGFIDAQRIGGLWYVFMDSLLKYKEKAEMYVPQPPQAIHKNDSPDTLISFDGKDYVSAARAADITGYHQDYVGQLARSGKILSRQVRNRWYVDREGILAHKEEKDNLLGAVQAESVGIKPLPPIETSYEKKIETWEPLRYHLDDKELIPSLVQREEDVEEYADDLEVVQIPIRVVENRQNSKFVSKYPINKNASKSANLSNKTIFYAKILGAIFAFFIAVFFIYFYIFLKPSNSPVTENGTNQQSGNQTKNDTFIKKIGDLLEPILTKDIQYTRN